MDVPPGRSDFETALQRIVASAAAAGQRSVTFKAGELHAIVGWYPVLAVPDGLTSMQ
jgi:hypothetical protein